VGRGEGLHAGGGLVEHGAQAVQVRARVGPAALQDLGRHEAGSAEQGRAAGGALVLEAGLDPRFGHPAETRVEALCWRGEDASPRMR